MEPREIKGLEIAAKTKLTRQGKSNLWLVPSQTNKQEKYTVALDDEKPSCTCRDHEFTSVRAPQRLTEFNFDHVERNFDVAVVIVLQGCKAESMLVTPGQCPPQPY